MQLSEFLDFEAIRVDLSAGNKRQLLNQLAQIAAARLNLDPSAIADAVAERERLGSTGFGGGVAIPHGKLPGLKGVTAVFARLDSPIDFDAVDDQPVDLVVLLLAPVGAGADHLKALSRVARLLRTESVVDALRHADGPDDIYDILTAPIEGTYAA